MKKVVDTNFRQSPKLTEYLAKSPQNFAVLTDYSAMEVYKGNTLPSIYRSVEILSQFPRQVVILRGTTVVCGLRGRKADLRRRLVDEKQTRGFSEYCRHVKQAEAGNLAFQKAILKLGREATSHLDRVYQDATEFSSIFSDLSTIYSPAELKVIRTTNLLEIGDRAIITKIIKGIYDWFVALFRLHPNATFKPTRAEVPYLFVFRTALCSYLLFLRWVAGGSQVDVKPGRILNDLVDINFVSFALYFDGILSEDKKLLDIYRDSRWLLQRVFSKTLV